MINYRDYIFTFLYQLQAPPDNNSTERAIWNIRVKTGSLVKFKSPNEAFTFAVLQSVTDTKIKKDQNAYL